MVSNTGTPILFRNVLNTSSSLGTGETEYETADGRRWHDTQPFERPEGVIVGDKIYQYPGNAG